VHSACCRNEILVKRKECSNRKNAWVLAREQGSSDARGEGEDFFPKLPVCNQDEELALKNNYKPHSYRIKGRPCVNGRKKTIGGRKTRERKKSGLDEISDREPSRFKKDE